MSKQEGEANYGVPAAPCQGLLQLGDFLLGELETSQVRATDAS